MEMTDRIVRDLIVACGEYAVAKYDSSDEWIAYGEACALYSLLAEVGLGDNAYLKVLEAETEMEEAGHVYQASHMTACVLKIRKEVA